MIDMLTRVSVREPLQMLDRPVDSCPAANCSACCMGLALHPQPELLLLDEPAAGIDFQDQEKFYDLIARLNAETGVTILLVSHDLSVVSRHAHHVLCLKDGRIQCQGPPQGHAERGNAGADVRDRDGRLRASPRPSLKSPNQQRANEQKRSISPLALCARCG